MNDNNTDDDDHEHDWTFWIPIGPDSDRDFRYCQTCDCRQTRMK